MITAFLTTSLDLLGRSITEIYGKVKILQGIMICCTEFFFRLYSGERRISLIAAKMGEQVKDFEIDTSVVVLLEIVLWLQFDTIVFFLFDLLSSLVCFWNIIGGSKQIFIFVYFSNEDWVLQFIFHTCFTSISSQTRSTDFRFLLHTNL